MNYKIGILTTAAFVAALILSGCENPSNKMESAETSAIEAERDMEIAKSEVEAELRIYRAENADRIMEYNRTIDDIKQRIENESDDETRERLETRLDGYETTHRELKREVDNYTVTGKENWNAFKDNFSNKMDNLGDSLNDFFSTTTTASAPNQP